MKTSKRVSASQKLAEEIRLARLRLAKAQSQLESAKQQSRAAKRRRKEAKQAARRAKKKTKQAKRGVGEAKRALAEAQGKLAKVRRRKTAVASKRKAKKPAATVSPKPAKRLRTRPRASGLRVESRPVEQVGLNVKQGPGGGKPEAQQAAEATAPESQVASPGQATPPAGAVSQQS